MTEQLVEAFKALASVTKNERFISMYFDVLCESAYQAMAKAASKLRSLIAIRQRHGLY